MGEYATLSINGCEIDSWKNCIGDEAASLFTAADLLEYDYVREFDYDSQGKVTRKKKPEIIPGYKYINSAKNIIQRLELLGYTVEKAKQRFEAGAKKRLLQIEQLREDLSDHIPSSYYDEQIALYEPLTFETWLRLMKEIIEGRLERVYTSQWEDGQHSLKRANPLLYHLLNVAGSDNYLFHFPSYDSPAVYRALLELVSPSDYVEVDFTFLVGWVGENSYSCRPPKTLILTEGSSDKRVLEATLRVLHPHLHEYFSFMDFDTTSMPGSAGQLMNVVKAFAATGRGGSCIAIFDNDAAGYDSMRQLQNIPLPPGLKFMALPSLDLAKNYPTVGPQGQANMDINGSACSIELYLGKDVLTNRDGHFTPVKWAGFNQGMRRYQGEIQNKADIQEKYFQILSEVSHNPTLRQKHDWEGMTSIFQTMFALCCSLHEACPLAEDVDEIDF